MTLRPFRALQRLVALLRGEDEETLPALPAAPRSAPALDVGLRLQERWRESGREPGVLVDRNGNVLVVCADGVRSRIAGVWRRGHFFTAAEMRAMHRPPTRLEWLRLQNDALQNLPPTLFGDGPAPSAMAGLDELPHGIVRRAPNGDMYVRTFNFAASLVRGRWHVGNRFTCEERQAMAYVRDRVERETIVTIARAALGVPRTDATFV